MCFLRFFLLGGLAGAMLCCTAGAGTENGSQLPADHADMVWIEQDGGGFWMDETEVTTADFRSFVEATGYRTEADSFGWSGVFDTEQQAWVPITGANWEYPEGPSAAPASPAQPVTQVSFKDATAYARWAGKRLPNREEWMQAATQSGRYRDFPWGEEMLPDGEYRGNWWQGPFPVADEVRDGFAGIAEVRQFPAAENGLYDIAGNVWEWTSTERPATGEKIIKGGSFLCSTSYCTGFNLQQEQYTPADSGLNHLGFRCVAK